MKQIRVNILSALILLSCSAWSTNAAEPRKATSNDVKARKSTSVVQVSSEEPAREVPDSADETDSTESVPAPVFVTEGMPRTWTLRELEEIANSIHPMLQRDRYRIESARGDALQAGLYPNPHFDTNNPQVFTGAQTLLNAGIMQEFVVMGKLRLDKAAAVKTVQQTEFAFVQDRFLLMTAIRQQFYSLLAAQRRFQALERLQKITSSSLETGRKLEFPAGEVAHIDVLILEIDNQRVESDLENAARLLRGARNQLGVLIGDSSISSDKFEGSIYDAPPQYDEKILNQFVTADSAYVKIAKLDIERNEFLLQRAIVEPYPNITLGPAYQWGLTKGSEQYWLTVTFPIPAWNRNQGNIISQRGDLAASRKNLETAQLELLRRVADAFSRHRGYRAQSAKYEKQIIPNVKKVMDRARTAFAIGEYDFARYLQVQRTFVEANMTRIDILENVWTSAAELSGLLQLDEF